MGGVNLQALVTMLIAAGQEQLAAELAKLKPENALQGLVLRAMVDAIERNGLPGAESIADKLVGLLNDEDVDVTLDLSDMRLASDMLAALQQIEADEKAAVRDAITRITEPLKPILSAVLRIAIAGG